MNYKFRARENLFALSSLFFINALVFAPGSAHADVLCKNKKTSVVTSRKACQKVEVIVNAVQVTNKSSTRAAANTTAASFGIADTGAVSTGSDTSTGLDVSVNRTGATGGTINNTGMNISLVGDTGGDSTNVGLSVNTAGADTNYTAIFQGGNVGIGISDPDEALEIAGRLHLGQSSAPGNAANKLYNLGGALFWGGQSVALGTGFGTITAVNAGTGLAGGGSSGAVTLNIDSGTNPNNIVQLNSSAQLPAVSGVNLTALNASSLSTGTVSDSRLSGSVSLLGPTIALGTAEVAGILLPVNGGTGAASLDNLIALGTQSTGNYVRSVATGTGLTGGASGIEGASLTIALDQDAAPTWTAIHSFTNKVNFGTTTASVEVAHLNGRIEIEPASAPSTSTNKLYNVGGEIYFNGQNLTVTAAGGDITSVTAGTGLTGTAASGDVTLNVNVGTAASNIVQLDGSSRLPAVSGVNLTNLNANNLASGTIDDTLLSGNVTKLGTDIGLAGSEVSGILPVTKGGTGATTLTNLFALGADTTGNYVAAIVGSTGITLGSTGTEGGTATLSIDQSLTPIWTGTHTFSGVATDITTGANQDFAIVPNGTGKVGIGTNVPSAMLDTVMNSTSITAANETAAEINLTDTGIVNTGIDNSIGIDVNVSRTGATGGTINSTGIDIDVAGTTGGASTATGLNVNVAGADTNYAAIFNGGRVGIGISSPIAQLQTVYGSSSTTGGTELGSSIDVSDAGVVTTGTDDTTGLAINVSRTLSTGGTISSTGLDITVTGDNGAAGATDVKGLSVVVSGADTNVAATFDGGSVAIGDAAAASSPNIPTGSLVIGNGAFCVDNGGNDCDNSSRTAGTIYAHNTTVASVDLAEEFPIESDDVVEPGDIVMIDSHVGTKCIGDNKKLGANGELCQKTEAGFIPFVTRAGDSGTTGVLKRVIGVVSTSPGITLGGFGQHELRLYRKVPVALAGRIPVKVSLENGAIEVGDRVKLSSKSGIGMRSEEHQGLGIIGIALEPFDANSASDRVLVLVR